VDGCWQLQSTGQLPLDLPLPHAPLRGLRLKHFLDDTVRGGGDFPTPSGQPVLSDQDLLPRAHPFSAVSCTSVFSPTRPVQRSMTVGEYLVIYSAPKGLSKVLSPAECVVVVELIVKSAPGGLMSRVWENWHPSQAVSRESLTPGSVQPPVPASVHQSPGTTGQESSLTTDAGSSRTFDFSKAVKSDDAEAPTFIWDDRIWRAGYHKPQRVSAFSRRFAGQCPLSFIRCFCLRWWRRHVLKSLLAYLRDVHGSQWSKDPRARREREVGRECLWRAAGADWWEWRRGSTLMFWRWPPYARQLALEGHKPWFTSEPPGRRVPQRAVRDADMRRTIRAKLDGPLQKRYIVAGTVKSLTNYFAVPKGETDLRMVYDATKTGLNASLWVPSFPLPTTDSLVNLLTTESWMSDIDLGEHFLNFPLHEDLQLHCGMDLRPYYQDEGRDDQKTLWMRWSRCMMGLKPSPYFTIKATHLAYEVVWGSQSDASNAMQWERIQFNLPGSEDYTPLKPWMQRIRRDGTVAGSTPAYVDDLRPVGSSEDHCFHVAHQTASRLGYLGIQNASRKTRPPSQKPGAWAGVLVQVEANGIYLTTSQDKWDKGKSYISELQSALAAVPRPWLDHKTLERIRGFLVHLQRVYPAITPFLKGLHLTIDSWRPGRDDEGWKADLVPEWDDYDDDLSGANVVAGPTPTQVRAVPRLAQDMTSLADLFQSATPSRRAIRPTSISTCIYGFADASATGFGSSLQLPTGHLLYRYGLWGRDSEAASSNYRELRNLVEVLEDGVSTGVLHGSEVFLFTDNFTAEAAFYRGNSSSRALFQLILRLRRLDMGGSIILHVVHIAGTRMVSQGTDGLSRGDLGAGVMVGESMLSFVPLHLSAVSRSQSLLAWIQSWAPDPAIEPLSPEDWFYRGHGLESGSRNADGMWIPHLSSKQWYLWAPPPAVAAIALQELGVSRHKRPHLGHLFVCPRLFTHKWRKALFKLADTVFELPAGCRPFWSLDQHEPLLLGLLLPFSSTPPWQHRQTDRLLDLAGKLRALWKGPEYDERGLLRQFFSLP
jgi:hypothetical protein